MHTAGASSLRTAAAAVDPEVEPPPLPSVAAVLEVIQGMVRYVVACQLLPESDWDKPPEIKGLAGMTEDRFRRIAEQLSFLPAHTQTGLLKLQRLAMLQQPTPTLLECFPTRSNGCNTWIPFWESTGG